MSIALRLKWTDKVVILNGNLLALFDSDDLLAHLENDIVDYSPEHFPKGCVRLWLLYI